LRGSASSALANSLTASTAFSFSRSGSAVSGCPITVSMSCWRLQISSWPRTDWR
jgi:hypothetical protein